MTLSQIKRFENLNEISINVYIIEKQKEILSFLLTDRKRGKHVNLLYVQDPTIIQSILHRSRIYLALWDRKLQQRKIEYISVIGSYTFKKEKNYKYFQQYFF